MLRLLLVLVVFGRMCNGWMPLGAIRALAQRTVVPASITVAGVLSGPQVGNAASLLEKSYERLKPFERLSTTPLFYVCNSGGNPYLQEDIQAGDASQRIIVYFMSSEDASDYLNEMAQGSPHNINDFRVMTTSMDKVMEKIQRRKQSRKVGRYPMSTIYRIQPSSRQSENAESIRSGGVDKGNRKKSSGITSVPVFSAPGMGVMKSSGKVIAPYYFAYEDLLEDWQELQQTAPEGLRLRATPVVEVHDLTDVLTTANDKVKAKENVGTVGIVPPRREIELLRRYYGGNGNRREFEKAKIMRNR